MYGRLYEYPLVEGGREVGTARAYVTRPGASVDEATARAVADGFRGLRWSPLGPAFFAVIGVVGVVLQEWAIGAIGALAVTGWGFAQVRHGRRIAAVEDQVRVVDSKVAYSAEFARLRQAAGVVESLDLAVPVDAMSEARSALHVLLWRAADLSAPALVDPLALRAEDIYNTVAGIALRRQADDPAVGDAVASLHAAAQAVEALMSSHGDGEVYGDDR